MRGRQVSSARKHQAKRHDHDVANHAARQISFHLHITVSLIALSSHEKIFAGAFRTVQL